MNIENGKENLSAEQSPSREEARLSRTDGDEKRAGGNRAPSGKGTQTPDSASLLETAEKPDFSLPKAEHLRKPAEFKRVYAKGKRFDGRLMSVFVLSNDSKLQRLGITASRKGVGNAVQRNRAKRLLREAFRLSKIELQCLQGKYDFVVNARRGLLKIKMPEAKADFQRILQQIARFEKSANNAAAQSVNLITD